MITNETVEAAGKAAVMARNELSAAATTIAKGAADHISGALGDVASVGSKWAYVWVAQKIVSQVLDTAVSVIIVIAIAYVVIFFMRKFLSKLREIMYSSDLVEKVSDRIRSQISIDNATLLEAVDTRKNEIDRQIANLTRRVTNLDEKIDSYQFEPIRNHLHDLMREYASSLKESNERLTALENKAFAVRGDNYKKIKEEV